MTENGLVINENYINTLNSLKLKIKATQIKATISVNSKMIILYWEIGKTILERQNIEGWGSKVIDKLSADLSRSFPEMKGFSSRNLKHMRRFADTYKDFEIVKQLVSLLPWGHNIVLLNKLENLEDRLWYAKKP